MLLELMVVISAVVGGFVVGRIINATRGNLFASFETALLDTESAALASSDQPGAGSPSSEKVTQVAANLKRHAESMAASVDEHQSKIQAYNNSLLENEQATAKDVSEVVAKLIEANREMQQQLNTAQERIHEQSMELESAERRAFTDALTRIPNRGAFDRFVAERHQLGAGQITTMALLDVDHFKKFNDNYGHLAGDEVLRVVATLLHARLNKYGLVARYGGEEFAVVFQGVEPDQVKELIEKARIAISERETLFDDKSLRVSASIGVAPLEDNESIEEWIARADSGLYQSKEAGRNCSHWMEGDQPVRITCSTTQKTEKAKATESESDVVSETVSEPDLEPSPPVYEAFADLPNPTKLGLEYREIRERMLTDVPVFVMAIRHHAADEAAMKSLLPVVRSTLRSVDRIGYLDESTLLVCMLSAGEEKAHERGMQICRSTMAMGKATGVNANNLVTIGIAHAVEDDPFEEVVTRAIDLAQQGWETDEPVCLQSATAASN
jgi:diguanylate cyclase